MESKYQHSLQNLKMRTCNAVRIGTKYAGVRLNIQYFETSCPSRVAASCYRIMPQLHLVQPFLSLGFEPGGRGNEDVTSVGPVTRLTVKPSPGDDIADRCWLTSERLLSGRSAAWITFWYFIVDSFTCHTYNKQHQSLIS